MPVLTVSVRAVVPEPFESIERVEGSLLETLLKFIRPNVRELPTDIVLGSVKPPVVLLNTTSSPDAGSASPTQLAAVDHEVPAPLVPPSHATSAALLGAASNASVATSAATSN